MASVKPQKRQKIQEYINTYEGLLEDLRTTGGKISAFDKWVNFIRPLPKKYDRVRDTLKICPEKYKMSIVKGLLLDLEKELAERVEADVHAKMLSPVDTSIQQNNKNLRGNPKGCGRGGFRGRGDPKGCGAPRTRGGHRGRGHYNPGQDYNPYYYQQGHTTYYLNFGNRGHRGYNHSGRGQPRGRGHYERSQAVKNALCYRCNEQGHIQRFCPKNTQKNENKDCYGAANFASTGIPSSDVSFCSMARATQR